MNLPILTKLLDAHRPKQKPPPAKPAFSSTSRENTYYGKRYSKTGKTAPVASSSSKRSYSTAFSNTDSAKDAPKMIKSSPEAFSKMECIVKNGNVSTYQFPVFSEKNKRLAKDPRPTRYELPEELDEENLFDNSFTSLSYTSKPLMVHPETATKQYAPKRIKLFEEGTSSSRFMQSSANDIVECRKISANDNIFLDPGDSLQEDSSFQSTSHSVKEVPKDNSQLFDQILENKSSKITIETKNSAQAHNLDHAKIISEVLKKYPHLVKSNKNIKLKILNTTPKNKKSIPAVEEKVKPRYEPPSEEQLKSQYETPDFTYESDVLNSKEAAKLIALGAENIAGPWICLICGTPGKALHFTSYYKFRKHLVEIHNEKPIPSICEYCGVKSQKRNYIVHHKLTKHGVPPPPAYSFPKCNHCSYIALNEALLIKHKTSHSLDKSFKFNLPHVQMASIAQKIGKKYPASTSDRNKTNMQCVYCMRNFLREQNLYAHLKIHHKEAARNDGLIDDSEEEQEEEKFSSVLTNKESSESMIKLEVPVTFENTYEEASDQYQIEHKPDGSICVSTKKPRVLLPSQKNKQQILNLGFGSPQQNVTSMTHNQKPDSTQNSPIKRNEFSQNTYQSIARSSNPDMVIIDNAEYIIQDNHLIPKKEKMATDYVISHASNDAEVQTVTPTTSMEYQNIHSSNVEQEVLLKKSTHMNQPYQIVVSSEEEYKALMNSNQTVLYDEADSNKELTELEVPDNSTIETGAIDLDNTQSNDNMMIIPDYHMNVPDTVSVDNSNIVVVYSHPVEDQNKQYSIITTQGEFIQPTAIITQNYETVTTCSPVTSHTAIEDSWQNNVQDNVDKLSMPTTELETMAVGESITIAPMENVQSNSLHELTEIQLATSEPVSIQVAQTETCINALDASNIITTISQQIGNASVCQQNSTVTLTESAVLSNMTQQVQIQSLPSTNDKIASISLFDQATSVNTLEEQASTADEVTSNSHELETVIVQQILNENNDVNTSNEVIEGNETSDTIIEDTDSQVTDSHDLIGNTGDVPNQVTHDSAVQEEITEEDEQLQEPIEETQIQEETIENIARHIDESQNALNITEQSIVTDQTKSEVPFTKIAKAQIENLTSEWSEDENEVSTEQNSLSNAEREAQNDENVESPDTEESIENIQKEIDKQVPSDLTSEEDVSVTKDTPPKPETPEQVPVESQEKISTLLNDWDDNDSQEEDTPVIPKDKNYQNQESVNEENQDENVESAVNSLPDAIDDTTDKSENVNKNDNIKRLVSDWDEDDDEEENKD